ARRVARPRRRRRMAPESPPHRHRVHPTGASNSPLTSRAALRSGVVVGRRSMPRSDAPTLAEHRRRQRAALLSAATELLVTQGVKAVTPAAVGAAAGLARSSVYQYFGSGAAIVAAIIEDAFPRANEAMAAALAGLTDPLEIMATYVRETIRLAAQGAHRPAAALRAAE